MLMRTLPKPAVIIDGLRRWSADLEHILADRASRQLGAEPKTFALQDQRQLLLDAQALLKTPTVAVAGDRMDLTLAEFERRCLFYIEQLQADPNPDTWLIGLLCDAVRLGREQSAPTV